MMRRRFARLVYVDYYPQATQTIVVVLTDKFDKGEARKTVLKYMKPVWDVVDKPVDVRAVQFNEFSVMNVLGALDWTRVSNVVCVNTDFTPRLAQLLVRDQWSSGPLNLPCEADPVESALAGLRTWQLDISLVRRLKHAEYLHVLSKVH
ncbi:hypothetical protein SeLEV6574_g02996 [Synchytrium endobioticum]|uniref:Uncharacterized protein n=1 Tax=Synchytrium endobioticum TaxID=286115 RepID=A0A507D666_9FUNG|nr:hypothetical protein SeLEV6574_g02996 [Synchytrium endobioticum]